MPTNKDFKRLVRGRMQKTGEAYTTARLSLLKKQPDSVNGVPAVALPPAPAPRDFARLAGMSDTALKAKTGCTWERWVWALDQVNASSWSHREIAGYVHERYKIPGWWAQGVTVGYERIKGLREIGQRRDGGFEATKSRTVAVPVGKLYRAFRDQRLRGKWLPGVKVTVRTATPDRSVRMTWSDGTSVEVWLTAKGAGKALAAVQHRKLADREAATRMKAYWDERLDALAAVLTPRAATVRPKRR